VQAYEISPALLASILHALEASFPEYELWMPSHGDLIIVAAKNGAVPRPDPRAFASPRLRASWRVSRSAMSTTCCCTASAATRRWRRIS